jgi:phosphosulfolactate synthase
LVSRKPTAASRPEEASRMEAPTPTSQPSTTRYLRRIGVSELPARTSPLDPGYDPATLEGHLQQSAHLMSILKLSMACWMIAEERATRRKIATAAEYGVPVVTGGGSFEIAVAKGELAAYLDLCAELGVARVECGEGFTELPVYAEDVVGMAHARDLGVQFELGRKHGGRFTRATVGSLIDRGRAWLDAGALQVVIEAREGGRDVGLLDLEGRLDVAAAGRFVEAFGADAVVFEAPTKASQFALLDHFGADVLLGNVRLEELLRVEIYRRGLHADAFGRPNLSPPTDGRPPR